MTTFYNLVDPKLNWGVSFNYNPIYLLFVQPEAGKEVSYLPLSYLLFCQAFFFLPILYGLFKKFRFSMPFVVGAFASLFFSIFVTDFLFWSALHELPMVMLLLGQVRRRPKLKFPLVILSALLWAWCSGPLGFIGSFFILWLIRDQESLSKVVFITTSLFLSIVFLVPFPLPSFPEGARLTELSPIVFWPTQLWGPALSPNPLNYAAYSTKAASFFSTAVTNVLLVLALLFQLKNRGNISKELHVILVVSLFLVIDSYFGGALTQNLSVVMYGLPLLPFGWLLGSLGLLVGFGLFLNSESEDYLPFNLGFIILVFFYLSNLVTNFDGEVVEAQQVGSLFSKGVSHDAAKAVPTRIIFSVPKIAEILVSSNADQAKLMFDHKIDSKWTSGSPMKSNEWISLKLQEAINCPLLSISPGSAKTDFPRGVKVEVTNDNITFRTAAEISNWKGPVRANEAGLLYYGPQNEVQLRLENAEQITGLKISQTGSDSFYYWSVAEVRCGRE